MANDHTDERGESPGDATPVTEDQKQEINDLVEEQTEQPAEEPKEEKPADTEKEAKSKQAIQDAVDQRLQQQEDKPTDKGQQQESTVDLQKKILEGYKTDNTSQQLQELESLRKQVQFFQQLYGNEQQQQQAQQQYIQQQPSPQQQQVDWLDNIVKVSENELIDLASGDPTRATPVLKKMVLTAAYVASANMQEQRTRENQSNAYLGAVRKDFFERYEDLKEFPEVVRAVGNDLGAEYDHRGIRKLPHEVIDELGKRCRDLIAKFKGGNGVKPAPTGSRQGATGGNGRPNQPVNQQLTDQQKEMFDLFNE